MPAVVAGGRRFDVDAVAFDKDGTLIDLDATWAPLAAAWVHGVADGDEALATALAGRLGLDPARPALVRDSVFSAGTIHQIRDETTAVLAHRGLGARRIEAAVRAGTDAVLRLGHARPVPLADLGDLFGRLTRHGVPCAIVTSDDRRSADRIVATLGLSHLVTAVVGGDEAPRPKPWPDALVLAAERLGTRPDRLLMVGDSTTDQGAARAAGCPFVAVGRGSAAASDCDAVIDHVGELTLG